MKLSALVSPGTWELIERLRPHLDVTIDVLDDGLVPLLPERPDPTAEALRRLVAVAPDAEPGSTRERFAHALHTGNSRLFSAAGLRIGLFPIHHDRIVVGLLIAAAPAHAAPAGPEPAVAGPGNAPPAAPPSPEGAEDAVSRRIERLGWSLRATVEADIDTHERLGDEQHRSRWLSTTLRFLEHLHACESDGELGEALVQAAAIWGDVDARLYRRALDDGFVLHTALPAVAPQATPRWLPGSVANAHAGNTRVTSIVELEGLGWHGVHPEVLFMPVTTGGRPEWLLAVGGAVDARFERVLGVAARTMAVRFEQLEARQRDALRTRLAERLAERLASSRVGPPGRPTLPAQAARVLGELANVVSATHARLLATDDQDGPPRVLAAVGGSTVGRDALARAADGAPALRSPTRMVCEMEVGLPRPALLELGTVDAQPFSVTSAGLADTGAHVIGAWLTGALQGLSAGFGLDAGVAPGGFEERIRQEIERARRFGLEAGVLVIDTRSSSREQHAAVLEPVIAAVRAQLRTSDLLGRLRDGELAALLVHTNAAGTAVVSVRLAERLAELAQARRLPEVVLGRAAYPTGGETVQALVEAAREELREHRSAARN